MRRGSALLLTVAIAGLAVLTVAGPASAHNQVVSSTPGANQVLTALPSEFSITTNLPLLDIGGTGRGFAFEIEDAHGRFYQSGCVTITDATMTTPAALGAAGDYTIAYQLVSNDGHTVSGEIPFSWDPPSGFTPSAGSSTPQACPGSSEPAASAPSGTGSDGTRNSTVPLGDVLWIGGVLVAVAIAVIVTILMLTRRRRDEGPAG